MGKLDLTSFPYLTAESIRVLQAVEFKHKTYDIVPGEIIAACFPSGFGSIQDIVKNLCYSGLLCFETSRKHRGYRLTNLGYDFLALKELVRRHKVSAFGHQIGVGKESNIYLVDNSDNDQEDALCMKLTRLGRTCFRNIKNKRDYIPNNRKNKSENWLSLSKASALKEYTFMHKLKENNFPVPTPYAFNRHCIIMDYIVGTPMKYVRELYINTVENLYKQLMDIIVRFAQYGCIHGDFNEFNIILREEDEHPIIIDFPQMVSTRHINAKMFFERDVECIKTFFGSRFNYASKEFPVWSEVQKMERIKDLDLEVHATGFSKRQNDLLLRAFALNDEGRLKREMRGEGADDEYESEQDDAKDESEEENNDDGDENSEEGEENDTNKSTTKCEAVVQKQKDELNDDEFMSHDKRKVVTDWVQLTSPSDNANEDEHEEFSEALMEKYRKEKAKVEGNNKKMTEDLDDLSLSGSDDDDDEESFKSAESTEIDIEDSASQIRRNGKKKNMTINDVLKDVNQRVSVEAKKKIRQNAQRNASKNARRATTRVGRSQNKKSVLEYNKGWDRFDF